MDELYSLFSFFRPSLLLSLSARPSMLPLGARLSTRTHSGIASPIGSFDKSSSSSVRRGAPSLRLAIARRRIESTFFLDLDPFFCSNCYYGVVIVESRQRRRLGV